MRILDKESIIIDLDLLGFPPDTLAAFNRLIKKPNGIVLVTGQREAGRPQPSMAPWTRSIRRIKRSSPGMLSTIRL